MTISLNASTHLLAGHPFAAAQRSMRPAPPSRLLHSVPMPIAARPVNRREQGRIVNCQRPTGNAPAASPHRDAAAATRQTTVGLSHINFHADRRLLEQLKQFYCEAVGLRLGSRPPFPGFGYWIYAGKEPIVHLSETAGSDHRGDHVKNTFDHIAFDCVDRPVVEARLKKMQMPYRTEFVPHTEQVQLVMNDPAGNTVELNFAHRDA